MGATESFLTGTAHSRAPTSHPKGTATAQQPQFKAIMGCWKGRQLVYPAAHPTAPLWEELGWLGRSRGHHTSHPRHRLLPALGLANPCQQLLFTDSLQKASLGMPSPTPQQRDTACSLAVGNVPRLQSFTLDFPLWLLFSPSPMDTSELTCVQLLLARWQWGHSSALWCGDATSGHKLA